MDDLEFENLIRNLQSNQMHRFDAEKAIPEMLKYLYDKISKLEGKL